MALLPALASLAATGCRNGAQSSTDALSAADAMHSVLSAERLARLRGHCFTNDFLITAVKPRRIIVDARGCSEQVAETTYYLYLSRTGDPLVAGRTFPLHPETVGRAFIVNRRRLAALTDSAHTSLVTHFGPSATCMRDTTQWVAEGRLQRWDGEDFGVLLSEYYDEYRSSLTVEVHAGEPSCARLAGQPASH